MRKTLRTPVVTISLILWSAACSASSVTETPAATNMIQVTLSLLLIVGLLFGFSFVVKKFGLGKMINSSQFPVKVIGAISIGNNQRLMVIEVNDEWIVLGITPQNITTITSMPRQEAPAATEAGNVKFASWMQSALEKYQAKNNDKKN